MEQKLYSQLIRTLLRIPGIEDPGYRTALLGAIPSRDLPRSPNAFTDISNIVLHLEALILNSGENALLIFIENAKSRVEGLSLYSDLEELQRQIETILQDKQRTTNAVPTSNQVPPTAQSNVASSEATVQLSNLPNSGRLRDAMSLAYNLDELELLCADLNMSIENLGEGSLDLKIQRLIHYFRRRGRYEELVKKILSDRPHLINILQEAEVAPKRQQDLPAQPSVDNNAQVAKAPAKREKRSVSPKLLASSHKAASRQPDKPTLAPQKLPTTREHMLVYKSTIQDISSSLRTQTKSLTAKILEIVRRDLGEITEYVSKLPSGETAKLFKSRDGFLAYIDEAIMQLDVALAAWTHLKTNGFDGEVQLQYYRYLKNCRSRLDEAIRCLKV